MAKKFFSFLGRGMKDEKTNKYGYKECIYVFDGKKSKKIEFVQEFIIENVCSDFNYDNGDRICICITPEVEKENWTKLEPILKKYGNLIDPIPISSLKTKEDIWTLFKKLFEKIDPEDEIYFDTTHAFRYLPMLYFSVLNYAQCLKNIKISGIFYGAYEAGSDNSDGIRESPIFDLTDTYEIMQWASAANAFKNYGSSKPIHNLLISSESENTNSFEIAESFDDFCEKLNTVRGKEILSEDFTKPLEKAIENQFDKKLTEVFSPILDDIKITVLNFKVEERFRFIKATEYYIEHNMYQQALTMLQEGLISFLLLEEQRLDKKVDYMSKTKRDLLSCAFQYLAKKEENSNEQLRKEADKPFCHKMINKYKDSKEIFLLYSELSVARNNINHGGFKKEDSTSKEIINQTTDFYERIKALLKDNYNYVEN